MQVIGSAKTDYAASLHASLRAATQGSHQRIDRHPMLTPLLRAGLTWVHYELVLRAFLNLYQTLQPAIAAEINHLGSGHEYQLDDRISWLLDDLADIAEHNDIAAIPVSEDPWRLPRIAGTPALIGTLYVIEGSTLGGQIIAKQIHASLGVDFNHGARFFNAWGDATEQNWRRYWQFATAFCPPESQSTAISAAVMLFDAIERGLNAIWARWCAAKNAHGVVA